MELDTGIENFEDNVNPLDNVEQVLCANNWIFKRTEDDEIIVQITGKGGEYNLFFIWQEGMSALQFCCQYDMKIDTTRFDRAAMALTSINQNLWMGHFDIPRKSGTPTFRHTCLFRGSSKSGCLEQIEDLVDISLAQCERYYPVFNLLAEIEPENSVDLSFALMETQGES